METSTETTTSTQLIAFVEARLREARKLAEAAAAGWEPEAYTYDEPSARHIARWNPQRALADIATKEEIVRQYKFVYEIRDCAGPDLRPALKGWLEGARIAVLQIAKAEKDHPEYNVAWEIYFLSVR